MGGSAGPGRAPNGSAAGRLTTIRAAVEYDGTQFCGFQFQPKLRTVAGELERVFSKLLQSSVKVTSAGRTDAGVHATGQVVSFQTEAAFPFERFDLAANTELPHDVAIRDVRLLQDAFSARFSATERVYVYLIYNRRERAPLLRHHACHVWTPIEIDAMRSAAAQLVGEHDFRSFCGTPPESGPTIRELRTLDVRRAGDLVRIELRASGFLHRMARSIVGTLIECGTGRRDPRSVGEALRALERSAAGLTAPPQGLYLAGVRYPDGYDSFKEPAAAVAASALDLDGESGFPV